MESHVRRDTSTISPPLFSSWPSRSLSASSSQFPDQGRSRICIRRWWSLEWKQNMFELNKSFRIHKVSQKIKNRFYCRYKLKRKNQSFLKSNAFKTQLIRFLKFFASFDPVDFSFQSKLALPIISFYASTSNLSP